MIENTKRGDLEKAAIIIGFLVAAQSRNEFTPGMDHMFCQNYAVGVFGKEIEELVEKILTEARKEMCAADEKGMVYITTISLTEVSGNRIQQSNRHETALTYPQLALSAISRLLSARPYLEPKEFVR